MTELEMAVLMEDAKYYLEQDPSMVNIIDDPAPWLRSINKIPSQSIANIINDIPMNIQTSSGNNTAVQFAWKQFHK